MNDEPHIFTDVVKMDFQMKRDVAAFHEATDTPVLTTPQ